MMPQIEIGFFHTMDMPFYRRYLLKTELRLSDTTDVLMCYQRHCNLIERIEKLSQCFPTGKARIPKIWHSLKMNLLLWERRRMKAKFILAAQDSILQAVYTGSLRKRTNCPLDYNNPDAKWIPVFSTEGKRFTSALADTQNQSWAIPV